MHSKAAKHAVCHPPNPEFLGRAGGGGVEGGNIYIYRERERERERERGERQCRQCELPLSTWLCTVCLERNTKQEFAWRMLRDNWLQPRCLQCGQEAYHNAQMKKKMKPIRTRTFVHIVLEFVAKTISLHHNGVEVPKSGSVMRAR